MALRVCVVDRGEDDPAYPLIDETGVDVRAHVPRVEMCPADMARDYDVVLVGATSFDVGRAEWREAVHAIASVRPAIVVVDPDDIERVAMAAPDMQVRGCAARTVTPEAMRRTLEAAARGETAFPHAAVAFLLRTEPAAPAGTPRSRGGLTRRQREVVELIADGATDREIAVELRISEATAHKHVQNALRRVGARTRSHLVARTRSA